MEPDSSLLAKALAKYLRARSRRVRWREWLTGRRYTFARFPDRLHPLVIVAHSFRDRGRVSRVTHAVEQDWRRVPPACRDAYAEILAHAPGIIILQLRRKNVCGCLGHRHVLIKEPPFAEPHEAFAGVQVGEMDIAYERVEGWLALPLMDTALDTQFMAGSRLQEFREQQLRLRLLSILLHETHHMVYPEDREDTVRSRSLAFYRDALASYVEEARATLSLTIDRSFARFGKD
jgi:hypothetical protein